MGILSSLFTGVSGLNANGNALSVVGNNIANLSTIGFKSSRSVFADLVSSSLGGAGGAIQTGLGVALNGVQGNFSQGSLSTTSNALDLAIDGNGFFIMRDTAGATFYSRAGQFHLDAQNRIVDPSGFFLQGYQVNASGLMTASISGVTLPTTTAPPNPTTTVDIGANLNSQSTTGTFSLLDPAGTAQFSTSLTVYDSVGNSHLLTTYFTKTAANTWTYNVVGSTNEIVTGNYHSSNVNASLGLVRLASGTLTFTTSGALDTESVVTSYDDGTSGGTAGGTVGQAQIDFVGATPNQTIAFNFGTSVTTDGGAGFDLTTQFGAASGLVQQSQNGFGAGTLQTFSVETNGMVNGRFSNGQVRPLAQLALARFPDPLGLVRTGKNTFAESGTSGQPLVGAATSAGLGRVLANTLELSNVDLGESFIDMIAAQRGFQANSRVITTSDEVLQELVNLKR
ncbi:MAG: flagellar hook protein FlgE [Nitrospira sp.]|nr:flagellar hook protein FlgE [Nitrospira sp.]